MYWRSVPVRPTRLDSVVDSYVSRDAVKDGHQGVALSIVIPAKDEMSTIGSLVAGVRERYPEAEIVVVDDGSTDATGVLAETAGARVVRHPESLAKGAAVKSGDRAATGDILCFMDEDRQHDTGEISSLLRKLEEGDDMAICARASDSHAS